MENTQITKEQEEFYHKVLGEMFKENPVKITQWTLLVLGQDLVRGNAQKTKISFEADCDGKRYLIETKIKVTEV